MASRPSNDNSFNAPTSIVVAHNGKKSTIRFGVAASERTILEAISASFNVPQSASLHLTDKDGASIAVAASTLDDGAHYDLHINNSYDEAHENIRAELKKVTAERDKLRQECTLSSKTEGRGHAQSEIMISGKPATLSRVVLASLGTGRYRGISMAALESAKKHFGGDCEVSLHLLTDDTDGVDPVYNPALAP